MNSHHVFYKLYTLKLNLDASFMQGDLRSMCGMMVWDHAGQVVLSGSQGFTEVLTPLHVEVRVVLMGLEVVVQVGLQVRFVEFDSFSRLGRLERVLYQLLNGSVLS